MHDEENVLTMPCISSSATFAATGNRAASLLACDKEGEAVIFH